MVKKKFRCSECKHTWEIPYGAPRAPPFVHNAKALTFIGQKRIGAMPAEAVEGELEVVSVDLQQKRSYEDASRK
ncbi:MAG: hypothetical protein AB1393_06355 [Candidatus Edwardsbacteria bacterium]